LPLAPVSLFPGDMAAEPDWPAVQLLTPRARAPGGIGPSPGWGPGNLPGVPALRARLSLRRHGRLFRRLRDLATAAGVRHVHAEFADLPAVMAAELHRKLGVSYSVSVHARDVHACKYSLAGLLEGAAFVTACNAAARDRLVAECPALAARVHLIPHGLVLDDWPFSEPADRPHQPMRLLYAGRLVAKKGLPDLLRALALGSKTGLGLSLTIVGEGPDEPALRRLCRDLDIETLVQWRDVVPRRDVRNLLEAADALVAPSIVTAEGDRDGIPNVVMEALAMGTPVLATDAGSLGEVLSERTGWVCRQGDPEHLLARLDELHRNAESARDKSRSARRLVESEYDALTLTRQRAVLFESVLGAGP